jgi:hypothetical protein
VPLAWKLAAREGAESRHLHYKSRLHAEIGQKLERMTMMNKGRGSKNNNQKFLLEGSTGVFSQDETTGKLKLDQQLMKSGGTPTILVDVDATNRPVPPVILHRILAAQNYHCVTICYWRWRMCKTEDDQRLFLEGLTS